MSTLYIRLPSKSAADSAANWLELVCPFALVSHGGSIEREGAAPLPGLADAAAKAQRVVLLLAASDVTLLRVQVPPLSAARLKAALPGLVEDQLIADPGECMVVAGGLAGGLRTIAVVQRAWLELLARTLIGFGARRVAALPAQLCLPCQPDQSGQPGSVTAAINVHDAAIDVALRLSEQDGIGLEIAREQHEASAQEVIRTLCAVVPEAPVTLYVPKSAERTFQEAISHAAAQTGRIGVFAGNWAVGFAAAQGAPDLMAGLGAGASPGLDWRAWRWPMALAAAVMAINAAALNIDWWRMKSEANSQRTAMIQIYKSAYPKETAIIDPIAQMQQKIAAAKRDSGVPMPDDFTAISAAFGETWFRAVPGKPGLAIAALEYRERSLFVRFKPNVEAPAQQMKTALAERGLSLDPAPAQQGAAVWQIRSTK